MDITLCSGFCELDYENMVQLDGGKIKAEDICYWAGAGIGFGISVLKVLSGY